MIKKALITLLALLIFAFSKGELYKSQNNYLYFPIKNVVAETAEESLIQKIIQNSSPSVVTIEIERKDQANRSFNNFAPSKLLSNFLKIANNDEKKKHNIGTGFVVSSSGLVVTNRHVVSTTDANYNIITSDNKKYNVTSIYRVPNKEIAVLKINANNLKPLELANSNNVKVGQMAIAIGTVFGNLENTITVGIISGKNRSVSVENQEQGTDKLDGLLQTDAALNFGNSGGPLLNSSGQVIGINTISSLVGNNVGFAIPINQVKDVLKEKYNL